MKVKNILLPKWVAWFVLIILLIVFIQLYYSFSQNKISPFELISTLLLFAIIVFVLFFVSYRQIPYMLLMEVRK